MAQNDIPAHEPLSTKILLSLVHSRFEQSAAALGYDMAPAVYPDNLRVYADRATQDAFDMWKAGAAYVARLVSESTLETAALREKLLAIASESGWVAPL